MNIRASSWIASTVALGIMGVLAACSSGSSAPGVTEISDAGNADVILQSHDGSTPGSAVWSSSATKLEAKNSGGGLIGPSGDAGCISGQATYDVTISTKLFEWTACAFADGGYHATSGSRTLSETEMSALVATLNACVTTEDHDSCGADKPLLTMRVTDGSGDHDYIDDFYACQMKGNYVSNMDPVFAKLASFVTSA